MSVWAIRWRPVVADDLEGAYFGCVPHMGTGAGAGVVVPYSYQAQRLAGVVRQLRQVHLWWHMVAVDKIDCHFQIPPDDLVDSGFDFSHLFLCGRYIQQIVAFALFPLDMCVSRPRTAEHPHHRLV